MLTAFSYYSEFIQWLQQHLIACPSKKYFHIECPGCGFQTACIYLLQGKFIESLQVYPAAIPLLSLFVFSLLHLKLKFRNGALIIKWMQLFAGIIILAFYFYKATNDKIFV